QPPHGGEIVWEWHAWDHLIQEFDPQKANYGVVADHPERVDINFAGAGERMRPRESQRLRALGYLGGDDGSDDAPRPADQNRDRKKAGSDNDQDHDRKEAARPRGDGDGPDDERGPRRAAGGDRRPGRGGPPGGGSDW